MLNKTSAIKKNPREMAVDKLIEQIEKDPGLWKKTWERIGNPHVRPFNPISKTLYSGINLFSLALTATELGYEDNRWATYDQAKNAGYPVKRGEKSPAIVIFHQISHEFRIEDKKFKISNKTESEACFEINSILKKYYPTSAAAIEAVYQQQKSLARINADYFTNKVQTTFKFDIEHTVKVTARYSNVFNFAQMENVPALAQPQLQTPEWDSCDRAEQILQSSGVKIYHDQYDSNYYRPGHHDIHLTIRSAFKTPEAYYSTALHELAHAKINDGSLKLSFNPEDYSKSPKIRATEELRAEISSIFLCADIGLNYDVQNHAAYLHNWLSNFKNDKNELWNAVSESNRITDAILAREKEYLLEQKSNQIEKLLGSSIDTVNINDTKYSVHSQENEQTQILKSFISFRETPSNFTIYQNYIKEIASASAQDIVTPNEPNYQLIKIMPTGFDNTVSDIKQFHNEFKGSLERGLEKTKSIFPPLFTPGIYTRVLEEINEIANCIAALEPLEVSQRIHEYIENNSDSLISATLSKLNEMGDLGKKEIINQLNKDCYEIVSQTLNHENQHEITKGRK